MIITKESVYSGVKIPWYYGFARYEWGMCVAHYYIVPFCWLVRLWDKIVESWHDACAPDKVIRERMTALERAEKRGWERGFLEGGLDLIEKLRALK